MKDYLSGLKDLSQAAPRDLCPLFYHSLVPYVNTLLDGGWFSWVERKKDANYRKRIDPEDFNKKAADRLYPNEVLVQCPNINASVVAGVGPCADSLGRSGVLLRILNKKGECVNKYEAGQEFILNKDGFKISPLEYNAMFPELLVSGLSGNDVKDTAFSCDGAVKNRTVTVEGIENRCRYHKEKAAYGGSLLPGDFCMDVFHRFYPQVLSLLYHQNKGQTSLEISCPVFGGDVTVKAAKIPRFNPIVGGLREIAKKVFKSMFFPYDFIDDNIVFSVKKNGGAEYCRLDEKKEYYFNMSDKKYPCPSSLHALYPYMLLKANNIGVPWLDEKCLMHCPGCKGVSYSI